MKNEFFEKLSELKIIPVIAIEKEDFAIPLADSFLRGGLPIIEITFRTKVAASVIRKIKNERPEIIIGAGTLLTKENLYSAIESGASFGIAPGLNPDIVKIAFEKNFPFVPGVMTPSDIEKALSLNCKLLKFFPAGDAGGYKMLKSLSAPYGHTGVRFIPTGGVNPENILQYFAVETVIAVGGTWLAKKEDIIAGNWAVIEKNCIEVREVLKKQK